MKSSNESKDGKLKDATQKLVKAEKDLLYTRADADAYKAEVQRELKELGSEL